MQRGEECAAPFTLNNTEYTYVVGSDIVRDGMFLEVSDNRDGPDIILEISYSDETGQMTMTAFRPAMPLELVAWAIASAKGRLPPTAKG